MKININQQVRCIFTATGRDVYQAHLDQFSRLRNALIEAPAEVVMPLWEFAQIFGNVLYNGQTGAPFTVNNEIEFIDCEGRLAPPPGTTA